MLQRFSCISFLFKPPWFNHFISNKLFTLPQSNFLPGDSCIAKLLVIIHEIQTNFDSNRPADVRGAFLDN